MYYVLLFTILGLLSLSIFTKIIHGIRGSSIYSFSLLYSITLIMLLSIMYVNNASVHNVYVCVTVCPYACQFTYLTEPTVEGLLFQFRTVK